MPIPTLKIGVIGGKKVKLEFIGVFIKPTQNTIYVCNIYRKQPPLQDFAKLSIKVLRIFFLL